MKKFYLAYHKTELIYDTDLTNVLSNKPYDINNINTQFGFIKKNIYDIVKNNNKKDIRILYSVITRFKYFSVPVKQLYPYILKFQDDYDTERANKVIDNTINTKMNSLSFDKKHIIDKYNENSHLTDNEKLIFVLLTLFPTRRPVDYRKMLVSFNEPKNQSKLNYIDKYNYYYNKTFYFNITKNKKLQTFTVPDELDNILKSLIITKNNNDFLLSVNNKQLTQIQLSKLIMNTFYKIYDISLIGHLALFPLDDKYANPAPPIAAFDP
jgi:archaellin